MTTRILIGDVRERLHDLPDDSIHCCVTSPPYYGLRDYGVSGQLGLEPTPNEYIKTMVAVFREVRRVLRRDGTVWLNLGDTYAAGGRGGGAEGSKQQTNAGSLLGPKSQAPDGCKPKDLLGIPWALAFALRDDGWYLRSEIIWAKRTPMPESVTDRPTSAHEKVFLLSRSPRYFFDGEAVKEASKYPGDERHLRTDLTTELARPDNGSRMRTGNPPAETRNLRNVWLLGPEPFHDAHFATFPTEIPRRAILAGTSAKGVCPKCGAPWVRVVEKGDPDKETTRGSQPWAAITNQRDSVGGLPHRDTRTLGWRVSCDHPTLNPVPAMVLDPFFGAGTTGLVADQLGRDCIGIELNPTYAEMAERRIRGDAGMFADVRKLAPRG
jgi:DNA modification methylase